MRRIEFKSNLEEEICLTEKERDCLIDYLFMGISHYLDVLNMINLDAELYKQEFLQIKNLLNKVNLDINAKYFDSKGEEINEM